LGVVPDGDGVSVPTAGVVDEADGDGVVDAGGVSSGSVFEVSFLKKAANTAVLSFFCFFGAGGT
jgi:hypothetical protein